MRSWSAQSDGSPAPLEAAPALAYGPVIRMTLRRLARLSER
jgi:hypothetical protein